MNIRLVCKRWRAAALLAYLFAFVLFVAVTIIPITAVAKSDLPMAVFAVPSVSVELESSNRR
jgi:heme/copper-type cytochrome/quinol oxidase subunit 4